MSDAETIQHIMKLEGWPTFTDDPDDAGGPTKGGITLGTLSSWRKKPVTVEILKNLDELEARQIYASLYVVTPNYDRIEDNLLRAFIIDCGVLHGTGRASRWLQEACNAQRQAIGPDRVAHIPVLEIDGLLGNKSLAVINKMPGEWLRQRMIAKRLRFLGRVIQQGNNVKYAAGWLSRVAGYIDGPLDKIGD